MEQVTTLSEEAVFPDNLKNLDFRKRKKELFSMFMGEEKSVTFEISKDLVEVAFDKFGKSVNMSPFGETCVLPLIFKSAICLRMVLSARG